MRSNYEDELLSAWGISVPVEGEFAPFARTLRIQLRAEFYKGIKRNGAFLASDYHKLSSEEKAKRWLAIMWNEKQKYWVPIRYVDPVIFWEYPLKASTKFPFGEKRLRIRWGMIPAAITNFLARRRLDLRIFIDKHIKRKRNPYL